MNPILESARQIRSEAGYACVVIRGDTTLTSGSSGIKQLLDWLLEDADAFRGAFAADKIIGRAAASVFIAGGAAGIWAEIISETALALLERHGVSVYYGRIVPYIKNISGTDICPMEKLCSDISDPVDAYEALKAKIYAAIAPVS